MVNEKEDQKKVAEEVKVKAADSGAKTAEEEKIAPEKKNDKETIKKEKTKKEKAKKEKRMKFATSRNRSGCNGTGGYLAITVLYSILSNSGCFYPFMTLHSIISVR